MFSKSLKEIQQYDPFMTPPNADIAYNHRLANMIGEQTQENLDQICPCCFKSIGKKEFDLRCSIQDITFLGNGIQLYFKSIKMAIVLLWVLEMLFLVQWFVYYHLYCRQDCQLKEADIFSSQLTTEISFDLKFCFLGMLTMIILPFFAKRYYDVEAYLLKKDKYEPEHFAILLQGFPKCKEDDLKIWIYKQFGVFPLEVHIVYDIQEIKQAYKLKEKDLISLNKENIKFLSGFTLMSQSLDKQLLQKKQTAVSNELKRLDSIIYQFQNSKTYNQSGSAFIIFSDPHKVEQILTKYQKSFFEKVCKMFRKEKVSELKYCDKSISVKPAINPRDCMWKNFHFNNVFVKIIASIVFILFGYLLLLITAYAHSFFFAKLLWPYSFFISFFSYSIFHVLLHLTTELYLSLCNWQRFTEKEKIAFYVYAYFNVFLVCMLPYTVKLNQEDMLEMINILLILDALSHSIIKIFNFANIYRKIFASYICNLQKNKNPYPQSFLNRLMEGRKFKLGQNYHFVLRSLLASVYYSHAAPFAFIYYMASLTIQYWVQKYLLLRKCRIPPKFTTEVSDQFVMLLGSLPVIYVLGVYQYTHIYTSNTATKINAIAVTSLLNRIDASLLLPHLHNLLRLTIPDVERHLSSLQFSPHGAFIGKVDNSPSLRFASNTLSVRKEETRKMDAFDKVDLAAAWKTEVNEFMRRAAVSPQQVAEAFGEQAWADRFLRLL